MQQPAQTTHTGRSPRARPDARTARHAQKAFSRKRVKHARTNAAKPPSESGRYQEPPIESRISAAYPVEPHSRPSAAARTHSTGDRPWSDAPVQLSSLTG